MTAGRLGALASVILFPLATTALSQPVTRAHSIQLAQAPKGEAPLTEEQKRERPRKNEQEKGPPPAPKGAPPPAQAPPPPSPKAAPPPPIQKEPPPPPAKQILPPAEKGPPPASKQPPPDKGVRPPEQKSLSPPVSPGAPPAAKALPPDAPKGARPDVPRQPPPAKGPSALPKGEPAAPQMKAEPPPASREKGTAPLEQKSLSPPVSPGAPPAAKTQPSQAPKGASPAPDGKKDLPKQVVPGQPQPQDKAPTALPKGEPVTPGSPPSAIIATPPARPDRGAAAPSPRLEELKTGRTRRTEDDGKRTVIQEPGPGNRVIVKQDNRIIIHHDESERFRRLHRDARTERRPDGNNETFYVRSDGVRVVSVVDPHGRLVRRYRRDRDGREFSIIDNRRFLRNTGIAVGVGAIGLAVALNLPPPRVRIPREQYIVDYERASDDDLYEALSAPPVDELERSYSLEEVRFNHALRQRMRRVDLDTITFEFGSWEVREGEFPKLERVAKAMRRLLERNPDEVFLIAAYTDAVGSDEDNLSLSDRRAEAVAQSLTEEFGIPAENLVTQGYGEQYLKIDTRGPEARNRRVEVQRITPLIAER